MVLVDPAQCREPKLSVESFFDFRFDRLLVDVADKFSNLFAVLKKLHMRNALHAVFSCELWILVHVHGEDDDLVGILLGHGFEMRLQRTAGPAPSGIEIYHHQFRLLGDGGFGRTTGHIRNTSGGGEDAAGEDCGDDEEEGSGFHNSG